MTPNTALMTVPNDADLVAQSLAGDREAFGSIVARYQSLICSIAYSATGSLSRSEDLAQETFLTAWKQLRTLAEPAKLRAWLCGIARNLVHNTIRRDARDPAAAAAGIERLRSSAAPEPLPSDTAISREEQVILWRSIEHIPATYREPLVLYYRENHSVENVAAALGLSDEAVRQRLTRGRKLLHERVASFVEDALGRSAPGKAFTLGVLAAVPSFTASAAAATVAGVAAKGSVVAKTAGFLAVFNLLAASVSGFVGGYYGVRCALAASRTPRERAFVWRQTRTVSVGVALFLAALTCFLLLGRFWTAHPRLCVCIGTALPLTFAAWMAAMVVRYANQSRSIRAEERKLHPDLFADPASPPERAHREYKSRASLFGVPLVHIQYGVPEEGSPAWAVGWIAVGDRAAGILFALGGISVGTVSVGTVSAGVISLGAVSAGLFAAGAVALGLLTMGAMSFGVLAVGAFAVGGHASVGAFAVASRFAIGGSAIAAHANDDIARAYFDGYHAAAVIQALLVAVTVMSLLPVAILARHMRLSTTRAAVLFLGLVPVLAHAQADPKDWPTYNHDVLGTRHAAAETAISAAGAGKLQEKWRFPARGSDVEIGVIHATPVVVNGYVYFGTATDPAFYKLAPDGKIKWSYRNPAAAPASGSGADRKARFQSSPDGIFASALVTDDTVYFGDAGGWFFALDRASGAERWKVNARAAPFPGAHPLNVFFSSAILADGKVIVGGGTLEQVVAALPGYPPSTGRGFVMALDPKSGKVVWKYDVGPEPQPLDPPMTITDAWGEHVFHFGPATSSVWCTPSFDANSGLVFFGTDVNTAPRRPTADDPRLDTPQSCALIAVNVRDGSEKWVRQINPGDVWTNAMRSYDPSTGRYKDQSIGDTPKIYSISVNGTPTKVVGAGCKNGGFYVLDAADGRILHHTPIYTGPPTYPLTPAPDKRVLALPSAIGGLQTGCATDGKSIFTNGIDAIGLGSQERIDASRPPTAGRVVAISPDARAERWRHERPKIPSLGGPAPVAVYKNVGDPVASGVAVANGVVFFTTAASGKLVALDAATGGLLKQIDLGRVFSGPSVSRGRVYVGTGNTLFVPMDFEAYFPKKWTGVLHSFGLPGEDEISRLGSGDE